MKTARRIDSSAERRIDEAKIAFVLGSVIVGVSLLISSTALYAEDMFSISGRVSFQSVYALERESAAEDPSLISRLRIEGQKWDWSFHSWIEGGWDGTVRSPRRDHSIFKSFDEVYQDNTPYLEIKELFAERSISDIDLRFGIQRFSWGRLDEYPVNDLLNPWDYTRFLVRTIEERKIGAPSISAGLNRNDWTFQAVWEPWFIPYRLSKPNERWSLISAGSDFSSIPGTEIVAQEPDLPARTFENGNAGFRMRRMGAIEWALNFFHGYDPRPVFKTTALRVADSRGEILIDPGLVPSFHRITSIGVDAATVKGDWSLRGEAACAFNRAFNVKWRLWGYPDMIAPGSTRLDPAERVRDTVDYGIAADYRLMEDAILILQAQQTIIFGRPDSLFDRGVETLLWANLRVFWMNQKIESSVNVAYNPEHGGTMIRPAVYYVFTDSWKAGVKGLWLDGSPQSVFGSYAKNDQIEMSLNYSW